MSVPLAAEGIIGKHYRFPDYFLVGREKIREFSQAIQNDHPALFDEASTEQLGYADALAPLTFLAVAGRRVQLDIFTKFDLPINIARVFHRDQKLRFHRPIQAGDKLYFDAYLDSVLESHGTVLAEVRCEVTDADGNPVVTSVATMLGEGAHHEGDAEAAVAALASI